MNILTKKKLKQKLMKRTKHKLLKKKYIKTNKNQYIFYKKKTQKGGRDEEEAVIANEEREAAQKRAQKEKVAQMRKEEEAKVKAKSKEKADLERKESKEKAEAKEKEEAEEKAKPENIKKANAEEAASNARKLIGDKPESFLTRKKREISEGVQRRARTLKNRGYAVDKDGNKLKDVNGRSIKTSNAETDKDGNVRKRADGTFISKTDTTDDNGNKLKDENGNTVTRDQVERDKDGNFKTNKNGQHIRKGTSDEKGTFKDKNGKVLTEDQVARGENGEVLRDGSGNVIHKKNIMRDDNGNVKLDSKGNYLSKDDTADEEGNKFKDKNGVEFNRSQALTDKDGNLLKDKKGNYIKNTFGSRLTNLKDQEVDLANKALGSVKDSASKALGSVKDSVNKKASSAYQSVKNSPYSARGFKDKADYENHLIKDKYGFSHYMKDKDGNLLSKDEAEYDGVNGKYKKDENGHYIRKAAPPGTEAEGKSGVKGEENGVKGEENRVKGEENGVKGEGEEKHTGIMSKIGEAAQSGLSAIAENLAQGASSMGGPSGNVGSSNDSSSSTTSTTPDKQGTPATQGNKGTPATPTTPDKQGTSGNKGTPATQGNKSTISLKEGKNNEVLTPKENEKAADNQIEKVNLADEFDKYAMGLTTKVKLDPDVNVNTPTDTSITTISVPSISLEGNSIMSSIQKKDQPISQEETKIQNILSNLLENVIVSSILNVAGLMGVDITDPDQTSEKLEAIKANLSEPENVEKMVFIIASSSEIAGASMKALQPFLQELITNIIQSLGGLSENLVQSAIQIGMSSLQAIPIIGAFISAGQSAITLFETWLALMNTGAEITTSLSETYNGWIQLFRKLKEQKELLVSRSLKSEEEFLKLEVGSSNIEKIPNPKKSPKTEKQTDLDATTVNNSGNPQPDGDIDAGTEKNN